jgi:hypothetical protein
MKRHHKAWLVSAIYRKSLVCALISLVLCGFWPQLVIASPNSGGSTNIDQLPTEVWKSLENQAAAMRKITLAYSEVESDFFSLPITNYVYIDENRIYLRKVYSYLKHQNIGRLMSHEGAFDGIYFYSDDRHWTDQGRTNSVLVKYLPSDKTDPELSSLVSLEYLKTLNFYVPDTISDFEGFSSVESRVLRDMAESDSTEVKQEGEMLRVTVHIPDPLVLRARATDLTELRSRMEHQHAAPNYILNRINALQEMANMDKWHAVSFLLDPKYGYAAVKAEEFAPTGQKTTSIDSDQWQYFGSAKIWLPRQSVVSSYLDDPYLYVDFSNAPSFLTTDTLNNVSFTLPTNAAFTLAYDEPGAYFVDRTTPQAGTNIGHQVDYTIGPNTNVLLGAISDVLGTSNRRPNIFFVIVLSILAILPLSLLMISRGKRKK